MTSEIKTTDCYLPIDYKKGGVKIYWVICPEDEKQQLVEKKEGMTVLTKEQFSDIIIEAVNHGNNRQGYISKRDLAEYIATILTPKQDKNDK